MLSSLAGADALDILVRLTDLSQAGLRKVEANVAHLEGKANATNFSGFSKASKTMATDAEKAAGKGGAAGGGLGSLIAGFMGIPAPIAIAGVAIAGFAALAAAVIPTYEKVQQQELELGQAFKDHGESLDKLRPRIEAQIKLGENSAFTADDTRAAILKLTEAGTNFSDIEKDLPRIMDLATAHHMPLVDAARQYELALMGNQRAVKDLGILMPKLTDAEKLHTAAQNAVTKDTTALEKAQHHLADTEELLKGKHHLTTAEAIRLRDAHKAVEDASKKLKDAQDHLGKTQDAASIKTDRQRLLNEKLKKAIGDVASAHTPLQIAETKLSDAWERFSTKVAPALVAALGFIIDKISTLLGWVIDLAGWLGDLFNAASKAGDAVAGMIPAGGDSNPYKGYNPYKASGGPVAPGKTYVVGEQGPEMLVMGAGGGGYVFPGSNAGLYGAAAHSGGGGGSSLVVHQTTILQLNGYELARQMDRYLHRSIGLAGTGIRRPLGG